MSNPCIICGYPDGKNKMDTHQQVAVRLLDVNCPRCGQYHIEYSTFQERSQYGAPKQLEGNTLKAFIGYTREQTLKGREIKIGYDHFNNSIKDILIQSPQTVLDKIDRLLLNLKWLAKNPSFDIELNPEKDYTLGYCVDENEFKYYLQYLDEINYFKKNRGSPGYRITVDGWKKIHELKSKTRDSDQCFVAIWFTDEMKKVYFDHIREAIKRARYEPMIILDVKHDNEVTSQILAEIQKSKFVIADFTGQRAGVYFEAGFAKGLGLNVIWTCKKDWFDNKEGETEGEYKIDGQWKKGIIKEERHTHFDVNHRQFILWEDDTEEKLIKFGDDIYNSIVEQFGEGPLKNNEEVNT